MRNSIFLRLNEYKGDPISEYNKINDLIHGKECYLANIYGIFNSNFEKCELLRSHFVSFEDCLCNYTYNLNVYKTSIFGNLPEDIQILLLDEYLDYCELLSYISLSLYKLMFKKIWHNQYFNSQLYLQLIDIIKAGLASMNYHLTIFNEETNETKVIKNNEEAEMIAAQSSSSIKDIILLYLGTRNKNVEDKKIYLHKFIDLLEPVFKKYNNEPIASVREYVQLLRHPEMKKNDEKYKWFYEDESKYLDELFSMCLFVQHYSLTKMTLKEFEENKSKK